MNNIEEYLSIDQSFRILKWNANIIRTYLSLGCTLIGVFTDDIANYTFFLKEAPENELLTPYTITETGLLLGKMKFEFVQSKLLASRGYQALVKLN